MVKFVRQVLVDTWAYRYSDYPSSGDFSFYGDPRQQYSREGIYVGYRYFDTFGVKPRYPFGFGLSYTTFSIETKNVCLSDKKIVLNVVVTNTGKVAGKEVVQVYVSVPFVDNGTEFKRLLHLPRQKSFCLEKKKCLVKHLIFLSHLYIVKKYHLMFCLKAIILCG